MSEKKSEECIKIPITPVSKPRQTRSDKWKKRPCVVRYRAYADDLRRICKTKGYELGGELEVVFVLPMPKSWSDKRKKEMYGKPHQKRPDLDNIEKAFQDALAKEDSHVYRHNTMKIWGYEGEIIIK